MKPETLAAVESQHERCDVKHRATGLFSEPHCHDLSCVCPWPCPDAELLAYIRDLEAAQREALEWLNLAKTGECGIESGHPGFECIEAQTAAALAALEKGGQG